MMSKHNQGFTLIELLTTVALIAIILALGVPAFTQLTQNNRMTSHMNTLTAALQLARSEAVTRSQIAGLRPNGATWTDSGATIELQVVVDANGDGDFDDAGELVQRFDPLVGASAVVKDSDDTDLTVIAFRPNGGLSGLPVSFQLTATDCLGQNLRTLNLSTAGLIDQAKADCP